jgi:glycosyltransferase involved in cell wall biosynthesis
VGVGPHRAVIEAQIDREGLRGNVTLLGTRDDVPALMSRSRVLLQTSRWEGVSIAVLEAMMHGVVPVVSDVGDMRDAIEIGESGYIVAPDDIDAYAAHVAGLLADPQHWEALSRAGRERAEKRYSTGAITAAWHDALVRARAL